MMKLIQRVGLILLGLHVFALGNLVQAQGDAPSSLTTSSPTATSISLSWTYSSTEGIFFLERRDEAGSWHQVREIEAVTSYVDTKVLCDTQYSYRIRALVTADTYSDYSNVALGTTSPCTSLTVNSTNDLSDGICNVSHCSLREAILQSNQAASATPVKIQLPSGTISVTSALPQITSKLMFIGQGQASTIINFNGLDAGFILASNVGHSSFQYLTIRNAADDAILTSAVGFRYLLLDNVSIEDSQGHYLSISASGAVVEIRDSVFRNNNGVIGMAASDTYYFIERNSFVNNSSSFTGIIVFSGSSSWQRFINNTFSGNQFADSTNNGTIATSGVPMRLQYEFNTFVNNDGTPFLKQGFTLDPVQFELIANVFADGCALINGTPTSLGYNAFQGTGCTIHANDIEAADLQLAALSDINGQYIHAPYPSSPVLNLIPLADCAIPQDQVGNARPFASACTAGAVEEDVSNTPQTRIDFTVTTFADGNDGYCTENHCTLREAVIAANALGSTARIYLDAGTYELSIAGANEDAAATGDLDILNTISFYGESAASTIIDANGLDRIFDVYTNSFGLFNLSLTGGQADEGGALRWEMTADSNFFLIEAVNIYGNQAVNGGGLFLRSANLNAHASLISVEITNNNATGKGAGAYSEGVSLNLDTANVSNNHALGDGGGVFIRDASFTTVMSNFVGNSAENGGAVALENSLLSQLETDNYLTSTIFQDNQAVGYGGVAYFLNDSGAAFEFSSLINNTAAYGGAVAFSGADVEGDDGSGASMVGSSVIDNNATEGGAFWLNNRAMMILENSTIAMNTASGNGGAFNLRDGDIMMGANTVVDNVATYGGGIYMTGASLVNTGMSIIANNSYYDCFTTEPFSATEPILSNGYNFIENIGNCNPAGNSYPNTGDVTGQNPLLSPLIQFNFVTWIHYPGGSLLNTVPATECVNFTQGYDQVANDRPLETACDIGAVEVANLAAATGLDASFANQQVNLTWNDNESTESAYYVERSSDGGTTWTRIAELAANAEAYQDMSLTCGTSYHYRVYAFRAADNNYGVYSNVDTVSVTCNVQSPNLWVVNHPDVAVDFIPLNWTDNSNNETAFYVERSGDAGLSWLQVGETSVGTEPYVLYIDEPLACNTTYQYRVRAYNGNTGEYSPYSNVITAQTDPCIEPAPTSICPLRRLDTSVPLYYPEFSAISGNGNRVVVADFAFGVDDFVLKIFDTSTGNLVASIMDALPLLDMSDDGQKIVFTSHANFTGQNADGSYEIFLWNNSVITQISNSSYDVVVMGGYEPEISGNGSTIVFHHAGNLFTGQAAANPFSTYVWRQSSGLQYLTTSYSSELRSNEIEITDDGNTVIFAHDKNLTGQDPTFEGMIYRKNLSTGQITALDGEAWSMGGRFVMNADGSRLAGLGGGVSTANPDGNIEILLWTAQSGWQTISNTSDDSPAALIFLWMNDTGNRLLIASEKDLAGDNPYNPTIPSTIEYFVYDAVLGFSRITNHHTLWAAGFPVLDSISDDGTKAAFLLNTLNHIEEATSASPPAIYQRIFIADCPPPSASIAAPSNLQLSANQTGGFNLSWQDNSNNETSFIPESSTNAGASWTIHTSKPSNSTSHSNSALTCNLNYSYRLRAYNATTNSYSAYSNVATQYLPCFVAAPTNVAVSKVNQNTVRLTWIDASWNESTFSIEQSIDGIAWSEVASAGPNSSQKDVNVICGAEYFFRIRAYNATIPLYSDYSATATVLMPLCTPLSFAAQADTFSIDLTWASNNSLHNGIAIERSLNGATTWQALLSLPAESTSYEDADLECLTHYSYRLRATSANTALNSAWVYINTATIACPALQPSLLSSTGATSSSISLDWTVDTTATSFTLWRNMGFSWANMGSFNEATHNFTDSGLSCGTSRQYRIQTYRIQDSVTVYSEPFNASTLTCAPLAAPNAPTVLGTDSSTVSLSIPSKAADVTSLMLERSSDGSTWELLGSVQQNYLDTRVTCATSYQYRLYARRATENSPVSPVVHATTSACPIPILSTMALYQAGRWLFLDANAIPSQLNYGAGDWLPIVGDWDGNGTEGLGLYQNGRFLLRNEADGSESSFMLGTAGWLPIVGDWDGDGRDTIGLHQNGRFQLSNDNAQFAISFNSGLSGWQVVAGDWDGNGADSLAFYLNGRWQFMDSVANPQISRSLNYGPNAAGWQALAGDWNGDGIDGIGLYSLGAWRLRETSHEGAGERAFNFGERTLGWIALVHNPYVPPVVATPVPTEVPEATESPTPIDLDSDGDGLPDAWEMSHFGDLDENDTDYTDTDGCSNLCEYQQGLNPNNPDSDSDALLDGDEIYTYGTNPLHADTDLDGMMDGEEVANSSCRNPNDASDAAAPIPCS